MIKLSKKKNFLRVFSIVFAFFIWIYVVSSAEIEVTKNIPLTIKVPKNMAIKNNWDREIQYRIRGPGLFVRKFLERPVEMKFNVKDYYVKGKLNYRLVFDRTKVKLPLGVKLVDIQPRRLEIKLESALTKTVPIRVISQASLLEDNRIEDLKFEPKEVEVSGPKSLVSKINWVETKLIQKSVLNETQSFSLELEGQDSRIKLSNKFVNVSYSLESQRKEFTFSEIPIIFQTVSLISQVEPNVVTIVVRGDAKILEKMTMDDFRVIAQVPAKKKGETEVELTVELPNDDFELVSVVPNKVKMLLE